MSEQDRTKNILLANEVPYNTHPYSAIRVAADCYPKAEIEVGYILKRAAWGKGIATEACGRLPQFGVEATELDEIVAITDPDNVASQYVLLKCGRQSEGPRRAYVTRVAGFRITRNQWQAFVESQEFDPI